MLLAPRPPPGLVAVRRGAPLRCGSACWYMLDRCDDGIQRYEMVQERARCVHLQCRRYPAGGSARALPLPTTTGRLLLLKLLRCTTTSSAVPRRGALDTRNGDAYASQWEQSIRTNLLRERSCVCCSAHRSLRGPVRRHRSPPRAKMRSRSLASVRWVTVPIPSRTAMARRGASATGHSPHPAVRDLDPALRKPLCGAQFRGDC